LRNVWIGVGVAIAICLGVGILLQVLRSELPQRQQEMLECVVAAADRKEVELEDFAITSATPIGATAPARGIEQRIGERGIADRFAFEGEGALRRDRSSREVADRFEIRRTTRLQSCWPGSGGDRGGDR